MKNSKLATKEKAKPVKKAVVKKKATKRPKGAKVEWNPAKGLTTAEEVFARFYVLNEDTRRNATLSYNEAFQKELEEKSKDDAVYENGDSTDEDEEGGGRSRGRGKCITPSSYDRCYSVCATEGSKLLKRPHISRRITELLNEMLTEKFVDGELAKVVAQDVELAPKVQAIKEFNLLRKRTNSTVVEHRFGDLADLSDEELAQRKAEAKKALGMA